MNDGAHQAFVDRYMRARLYGYEFTAPNYLPVPRADEVHARLLVEAAIFGDANPEEHAAVMVGYILECDRAEALEAERQRRLPVLRVHEVAMDVYVEAAVLNLPITRREANILACYIVTEKAARTVPQSFLPVLHQVSVAAELFVMFTLIGVDRWTWDEVYTAALGYVQQLRIRQPFYTYSPPAWRRA